MVRAKFVLTCITEKQWSPSAPKHTELEFSTQYDPTIPEDQSFTKATPSGSLKMIVDNPAAREQLKIGQAYYLDLTPVPEPKPTTGA